MTKEEKAVVINNLAEQLNEYPHFYLTDIETLNAEQTAQLRRKCFENEIKLVVVKNTLFGKALEKAETIPQQNRGPNPADFDYEFNLTYGAEWFRDDALLRRLRRLLDAETARHAGR